MLARSAKPGGDQQRAELVAVQRGRVGLLVHLPAGLRPGRLGQLPGPSD